MQYSRWFAFAQARMGQGWLKSFSCTFIFSAPSRLVPGPHVVHTPRELSLQTSQFIPQAPVGMGSPHPADQGEYIFSKDVMVVSAFQDTKTSGSTPVCGRFDHLSNHGVIIGLQQAAPVLGVVVESS